MKQLINSAKPPCGTDKHIISKPTVRDILSAYRIKDTSDNIALESILAHSIAPSYTRINLYKEPERKLTPPMLRRFNRNIKRYRRGYPLAYILGHREFMSLDFITRPGVLIPRPETELVVESALNVIARSTAEDGTTKQSRSEQTPQSHTMGLPRPAPMSIGTGLAMTGKDQVVIDIGTGSGNIAIAIAKQSNNPGIKIYASDMSGRALAIASRNARNHNVFGYITFCKGNLFKAFREYRLEGKVDVIVSNPPYVAYSERSILAPGVRKYEPRQALFATDNGLAFHKAIISSAPKYLKQGGHLIMEMGYRQSARISEIVAKIEQFGSIRIVNDYQGIKRVIVCTKK